ncbi:MAG: hypothetical protein AAF847_11185 [Bacteroidota bacterium]
MELKIKIAYQELWNLIQQLPAKDFSRLQQDLAEGKSLSRTSNKKSLKQLILNGPVMEDEQCQDFQTNRAYFNTWRAN